MEKKIVTIVGARPQFIKLAPVSRVLREKFTEIIVNTGQHYDHNMAGIFFEELKIPKPNYDLGIGSSSHGKQTGVMLDKIEELILLEKPDAVLVYGDTNSTLAGALAASKLHIPLIHIEAGLRSFNKKMPEEINRVLTDHVSNLLFAPTESAVSNLKQENIVNHVYNVGDVMYDAVLYNIHLAEESYELSNFNLKPKGYYLATIHRAENTDDKDRMIAIFESLASIDCEIALPLHPRTKHKLEGYGLSSLLNSPNIKFMDPVSYLEMLILEKNALGIITDSGGVQKEAYFMKVPCFTLRPETEWIETVKVGWNYLVDPFQNQLQQLLDFNYTKAYNDHLFGDGKASNKIVSLIDKVLF